MKYENSKPDKDGYGWKDYCCASCGEYKKLKKRESDGIFLCKKCSKNQSLFMSIRKSSLNTGKKHNGGNNNE